MSEFRRQLGHMLSAGTLRGIPPAGVLNADRFTQTIARLRWVDQPQAPHPRCHQEGIVCPRMVSTAHGQWR
ncbi:MAG: hypothetical protein ACRDRU_10605 [Pseudonocardiaceae bacterium]